MKLLRLILFPIVPIYYVVTWLRNWLYDKGYKSSKSYDFPVICVGNLSTGGTGKTPMIEYLIRILSTHKQVATLSRGYKRKTEGFVLADRSTKVEDIGDEPFQFFNKFKNINVAVDANRQNGIERLRKLSPKPEVILLDDAYQHRKVKTGFNILLTAYSKLYCDDFVLPTGNLREPRSGAKRAHIIVVTKCPKTISESEKQNMISKLKPKMDQKVFFSHIAYDDKVFSETKNLNLEDLPKFTLVTGIANATPLVHYLNENSLKFNHLEYADHYNFKASDIDDLSKQSLIVTTEKDYMRLKSYEVLKEKLYYLPIQHQIDKAEDFKAEVLSFVN